MSGCFSGPSCNGTYRRKGQRGPLASALVRSDLPDPRSVLESLVGELTEFRARRLGRPAWRLRRWRFGALVTHGLPHRSGPSKDTSPITAKAHDQRRAGGGGREGCGRLRTSHPLARAELAALLPAILLTIAPGLRLYAYLPRNTTFVVPL